MRKLVFATLIVAFLFTSSLSQTNTLTLPKPTPTPDARADPPPGGIVLLADYVHTRKKGIDTSVGEIKGASGLVIQYDNGPLAGNVAWRMNGELPRRNIRVMWYQEQVNNGLHLYLIRGEDKSVYASFPETCANFYALNVNEQQLADFILMMMTYHGTPRKEVPIKYGRPTC